MKAGTKRKTRACECKSPVFRRGLCQACYFHFRRVLGVKVKQVGKRKAREWEADNVAAGKILGDGRRVDRKHQFIDE